MLGNEPKESPAVSPPAEKPPAEVKPPATVSRALSVKDRQLILIALAHSCRQGQSADFKAMTRLLRLQEVLDSEGVDEYYSAMDLRLTKRLNQYRQALQDHLRDGAKDPGGQPDLSDDEIRGPKNKYELKPAHDTWIKDSLQAMKWGQLESFGPKMVPWIVETGKNYDLKIDED